MSRLKNSFIASIGLLALLGMVALFTPRTGQSQTDTVGPPKPVLVINSPSEAVPVTGTINVSNLGNSPLPVRDVGVPLTTPVQIKVNVGILNGEVSGTQDVYTVPAGKRLVIEHVTLFSDLLEVGNAVKGQMFTIFGGESFSHHFDVREQAPVEGPLFVSNHPLLAFADAGTTVEVFVRVDHSQGNPGTGGYSALSGTLSGHLETLP